MQDWPGVTGRKITDVFTELTAGFAVNDNIVGPLRNFDDTDLRQKRGLAKNLFDATMKMFLRDNYIHGDLHGGSCLPSRFYLDWRCTAPARNLRATCLQQCRLPP